MNSFLLMHIDFKPIQLWRCLASCFAQICQVVNASLRAKNRSSAAENKSRHRHCTQPSNWTIRSGDDDQPVSQSIDFKCFILYNKIFHIPPCDNCTNGICQLLDSNKHVQFKWKSIAAVEYWHFHKPRHTLFAEQ